jgi:C4-dicarboxylate-specific signal transduction histidine kinase
MGSVFVFFLVFALLAGNIWQHFVLRRRQALARKDFEELKTRMEGAVRLSSLGEMAASLAHEINNPLAIILAKASLTRRSLESGREFTQQQLREALIRIEDTVDRISKIIKGIQTMARQSARDPFVKASVKTLIEDSLEICQFRLNYKQIPIEVSAVNAREFIECRPYQVVQILVNLINNSYDAILKSGMVHDKPWIRVSVEFFGKDAAEKSVEISVTDCGPGLSKDIVGSLMTPFFTTKPAGQGTGLGLSISKEIAKDHGGELYYDEASPNTRFVLKLPHQQRVELDTLPKAA